MSHVTLGPINARFKALFEKTGLSQTEFAARMGRDAVTAAAVCQWLSGARVPGRASLEKAVRVLGVSLVEFYRGIGGQH